MDCSGPPEAPIDNAIIRITRIVMLKNRYLFCNLKTGITAADGVLQKTKYIQIAIMEAYLPAVCHSSPKIKEKITGLNKVKKTNGTIPAIAIQKVVLSNAEKSPDFLLLSSAAF